MHGMVMQERTRHVLRRLTFGPTDDHAVRFDGVAPLDAVDALLADPPGTLTAPRFGDDGDDWATTEWMLSQVRRPDAGVHERMVWFWHGHLTSSVAKASPDEMMTQQELLRRHALGNFRTMLHEITLDPAMLYWLDSAGSVAAAPNENYARELMELFALGRDSGAYIEADVRAGAMALAGYWVDDEDDEARVVFEPDEALGADVEFLGRRVRTAGDVVDAVCDHPACARHVARRLHRSFVGADPAPARLDELASVFAGSGLEIRPLVEAIVRHPTLVDAPVERPRSPLEWYLAFERLVGADVDAWVLELLGQVPMAPPNVAGWPDAERWISSGAMLTKAQIALDHAWDTVTLDGAEPVGEILGRAGLDGVSDATRATLDELARSVDGRRDRSSLLHAAVAVCPEFNLT